MGHCTGDYFEDRIQPPLGRGLRDLPFGEGIKYTTRKTYAKIAELNSISAIGGGIVILCAPCVLLRLETVEQRGEPLPATFQPQLSPWLVLGGG
ncbi:MAG: hypothetical protein RIQ79_2132 [Verrucomicrobiota bacterium]